MAAKTTTAHLKEAPRLLTWIRKRLAPSLLYAFIGIFHNTVKAVYVSPLTKEISRHLTEMAEHTDPSSAEYAGLMEDTQRRAREVLVVSIAVALVTLMTAFAKHIVAASSATYSGSGGDRCLLAELLREVTRWKHLRSSLVTTGAAATMLQLASTVLMRDDFATAVMRDPGLLSVRGSLFSASFLAFLYVGVLALMSFAVKRKECSALVLVTLLLPAVLIPLCEVAVLYLCTKQIMGLGLSLLPVHDLLQGVQDLLYISAASVYYQWQC